MHRHLHSFVGVFLFDFLNLVEACVNKSLFDARVQLQMLTQPKIRC
jgi:hypothetical protein